MPKEAVQFEDFLLAVSPENFDFIKEMHADILENGCGYKIESAAKGYVVSYTLPKTKKVIANYVFRKNAMLVRIYGDNIEKYAAILADLPASMQKTIEKAPICKRLHDPDKCNARCPMGYTFDLNGATYKNCRYNSFLFTVTPENHAAIRDFLGRELKERLA